MWSIGPMVYSIYLMRLNFDQVKASLPSKLNPTLNIDQVVISLTHLVRPIVDQVQPKSNLLVLAINLDP